MSEALLWIYGVGFTFSALLAGAGLDGKSGGFSPLLQTLVVCTLWPFVALLTIGEMISDYRRRI